MTPPRLLSFSLFAVCIITSPAAWAATFKSGEDIVIDTVAESDVYVGGDTVLLKEVVNGDALFAGGEIRVQGTVEEDVLGGGGRIEIVGDVGDDVRIAAGEVRIEGTVGGDVIVFAGRVQLSDEATVRGDVYAFGGEVTVDGTVGGNVTVGAGKAKIFGDIGGYVSVEGDSVHVDARVGGITQLKSERTSIGANALFQDEVEYWNRSGEVDFGSSLADGVTATYHVFDEPVKHPKQPKSVFNAFFGSLLTSLLFASVVIAVFAIVTKNFFIESAKYLRKSPGLSMLWGFLYFTATPVIMLLLLLSIIGIPFSLLLVVAYIFSLYFAKPVTALIFAKALDLKYKQKWNTWQYIIASIGVFIVLKVIGSIPVIGWVAVFLCIAAGFGALLQAKWAMWKKVR